MKLYSVVMLFKKEFSGGYKDGISNIIVLAMSEEEAFGKAYDVEKETYTGFRLSTKMVIEVPNRLACSITNLNDHTNT